MDFLYGPDAEPKEPPQAGSRSSLLNKLAIVGASGLVFTAAVFGLGSLASAQTVEPEAPAAEEAEVVEGDENTDADEVSDFDSFSAEDRALIEQFEQCINDSGIGVNGDDADLNEEDFDAIDAAFEKCEVVLEGLSFDQGIWLDGDADLSEEDAAVFEKYDECLTDAGIDFEDEADLTEEDHEAVDAAFEKCDPILEDLSEDYQDYFDGEFDGDAFEISPEDEAVYERFEQCLTDGGLNEEAIEEGEAADTLTEEDYEKLDSLFEGCESILEDLSEDMQSFFEDCPDEHELEEGNVEESVNV